MRTLQIFPVIHYLDHATAFEQVALARQTGADGVFLIAHQGDDRPLLSVAAESKAQYPDFPIGINLLSSSPLFAVESAVQLGLDMVWADQMGVSSAGLTDEGRELAKQALIHPKLHFFASVAFKYQPLESFPEQAAAQALKAGFIPTTSGSGTGRAPNVQKISAMSTETSGTLAIASGMTPENVALYAPYLSQILVATGVAFDDYRMDPDRLKLLIQTAHLACSAS